MASSSSLASLSPKIEHKKNNESVTNGGGGEGNSTKRKSPEPEEKKKPFRSGRKCVDCAGYSPPGYVDNHCGSCNEVLCHHPQNGPTDIDCGIVCETCSERFCHACTVGGPNCGNASYESCDEHREDIAATTAGDEDEEEEEDDEEKEDKQECSICHKMVGEDTWLRCAVFECVYFCIDHIGSRSDYPMRASSKPGSPLVCSDKCKTILNDPDLSMKNDMKIASKADCQGCDEQRGIEFATKCTNYDECHTILCSKCNTACRKSGNWTCSQCVPASTKKSKTDLD